MIQEENSDLTTKELPEDSSFILQRSFLANRWISYVVGIVMDRFQPGIDGALGRGRFSDEIAARLRDLADVDGVMVLDEGHPDDLAPKVLQALQIMLGEEQAMEVIAAATIETATQK